MNAETESETESVEATVAQFETAMGIPVDDEGFRFTLTDALIAAGVDPDDPQSSVVLTDPGEGTLWNRSPEGEGDEFVAREEESEGLVVGYVRDSEEVGIGRGKTNVRRVMGHPDRTWLALYLRYDELEAMGIDFNRDGSSRPVLNVYAADGVIGLSELPKRDVEYETIDSRLYDLPKQMREAYVAVVEEGYTAAEWAEERELSHPDERETTTADPAYYVERLVEEACDRLNDPEREGREIDEETEQRGVQLTRVSRSTIRGSSGKYTGYRVSVAAAIKRSLGGDAPDSEITADKIGIQFDYPNSEDMGMLLGGVATDDEVEDGRTNERWVSVETQNQSNGDITPRYRVHIPDRGLELLGYDTDACDGAPIDVWAGQTTIAFQMPELHRLTAKTAVPEVGVNPSHTDEE